MNTLPRLRALELLSVCLACAPALAQSLPPLALSEGTLNGERRGHALAAAGDLDGDGCEDFWVGSPFDSTISLQAGAVRAVSGKSGAVLGVHYGAAALDHFGWSLANLGDVDGDGVADLAVGSPDSDHVSSDGGSVRVHSGAGGALLYSVASAVPSAHLGYSLCAVGDVNGDGRVDFGVGAPFDSSAGPEAGRVEIRSGQGGALIAIHFGVAAGDRLGIALAAAGDVDLDGRADLLAGAEQHAAAPGYAQLFSGPAAQPLYTLAGLDPGARFGAALAGGADVDSDGVPDFAVGASACLWQGAPTGAAFVYSGASGQPLFACFGTGAGEAFGSALAFLPDLDGDARAELAVGAWFEAGASGAAGIVRAISSASQRALFAWRGRSGGDRFGSALLLLGDCDGDGRGELLVGAPKDDAGPIDCGAALLHSTRGVEAQAYCSGKLNSQGCVPHIAAIGFASLSDASVLELRVSSVINNKAGILFFGRARAALPFSGGTLCVAPPIQRSAALHSGGSGAAADCSGVLALALDAAWILAHGWQAAERIDAQAWYRDPAHPDGLGRGLSDALEFSVWN